MGQHHLSRRQRLVNMQSAFAIHPDQPPCCAFLTTPIWIVDDILTSGATAQEALSTLQKRWIRCQGVDLPGAHPRDLRFRCRESDVPG